MGKGWIALHRQLQDHWLWRDKPFSYGAAWVDLLMLANHSDKQVVNRGKLIKCERGSVYRSVSFLADRWGWSPKKVRHYLGLLEGDGMVTTKGTTQGTTITLVNYGFFQGQGQTEGQAEGQTEEQQRAQRRNTNNNDKQCKTMKNKREGPARSRYGEYENVLLSDGELEKLQAEFPGDWQQRIERLSGYMAGSGKTYKNHLATIRNWARRDGEGKGDAQIIDKQQYRDAYTAALE